MKLVVMGIAAIIATLAGSFAASLLAGNPSVPVKTDGSKVLEFIKLDVLSVPVVRKGQVQGYVLARVAVGVSAEEAKKSRAAVSLYSNEGAFRAIYEEGFEFTQLKTVDIVRLADRMTRLINDRWGAPVVAGTTIESLNFVPYSEVRQSKHMGPVAQ